MDSTENVNQNEFMVGGDYYLEKLWPWGAVRVTLCNGGVVAYTMKESVESARAHLTPAYRVCIYDAAGEKLLYSIPFPFDKRMRVVARAKAELKSDERYGSFFVRLYHNDERATPIFSEEVKV